MKDYMLAMMSAMMPYMKPIFYFEVGMIALGLVVILFNLNTLVLNRPGGGSDLQNAEQRGAIGLVGKTLIGLAIFFFSCEVAGMILSAAPSINMGDENKFEFILVRFWMLGVASLAFGVIYLMLGRRSAE